MIRINHSTGYLLIPAESITAIEVEITNDATGRERETVSVLVDIPDEEGLPTIYETVDKAEELHTRIKRETAAEQAAGFEATKTLVRALTNPGQAGH